MRKDLRAETRPRAVPRTASPRVRKRYPPFPVYDRPESSDCGKRRAEPGHYGGETEKIALQLKATLENVTNLRPVGEDFRWYLKMKCGNCGEISEKWQYIRLMAEDNEKFKTIVEFECRGLEPVDFQPQAGFAAEGVESGTVFSDINLQEKDWTDYDEKARESVGIYEVAHQFVKC
ncbi:CXXC motif containing zinc binding protein isoform X2 [Sturnira hondurensis]|uniref:CXXC motif containing zinc binding protein isoform X2 n=1 Tax=Sturnira hondurensis TaxID=192404 RepID=UPI00187AD424|nr:CXXC motif containing zinc binding protein isoform X2 [Sturnira hondurensis]